MASYISEHFTCVLVRGHFSGYVYLSLRKLCKLLPKIQAMAERHAGMLSQ